MTRLFLLLVASVVVYASCTTPSQDTKPNIIYILADDLGYGELGVYGQQHIKTPHIDALAANGMLFTQHYAGAPVCAPSRYSLLSGHHTGHGAIRGNDEWSERGNVWNFDEVEENPSLEGQRPIPDSTITVAEVLKRGGYQTAIVGKWGLGAPDTEGVPSAQGFDYFYGYNCQRQAHQLYPQHLWENDERVALNNDFIKPHQKLAEDFDADDPESYLKYQQKEYAPALMQDKALSFISEHADEPFFLYYATPLPHLPLQVPQEYVDPYIDAFGEESPYAGSKYVPCRHPRAVYAGMISYLDMQVGELIAHLKELDIYDNTLVIFTSDNGPAYTSGVDADFFNSAGPFINGAGRTKGNTYEGGIRVPMIASWPAQIAPGTTTDHISAFWDVMPTLAQVAQVTPPAGIDGISFLPTLLADQSSQGVHDHLYWEIPAYGGQQAVRLGQWKGIRRNIKQDSLRIELYDIINDPQEQHDVSAEQQEITDRIASIMSQSRTRPENPLFRMKALGDNE